MPDITNNIAFFRWLCYEKNTMKKLRFPIALLLALVILPAVADAAKAPVKRKEGVAIVVNDDIITLSDIRSRTALATAANDGKKAGVEEKVSDLLIDERLQLQESRKLGITVTDEQIDNGFAAIAQQNGMTADAFKKALAAKGVPLKTLRDQLRAQIAWSYVVRRKLRPQVNISESDIDAVFDKMERAGNTPELRVAEILLTVDDPSKEADVRKKAEGLIDKMLKGASFAATAREFSQAPGSDKGGDLGWILPDQLPGALADGLSQLKPGQISPPLRGPTGWHILYLIDQRGGGATPLAAKASAPSGPVLMAHIKRILIPLGEKDPPAVVSAKLARAKMLKDQVRDCDLLAKKSADFPDPATGDMGEVDVATLPGPVAAIVKDLKDNELSSPIKTDRGIALIMVCKRETRTPADLAASASPSTPAPNLPVMRGNDGAREKIATELGMERLDMLQRRYLQDLRAAAFIEKRI